MYVSLILDLNVKIVPSYAGQPDTLSLSHGFSYRVLLSKCGCVFLIGGCFNYMSFSSEQSGFMPPSIPPTMLESLQCKVECIALSIITSCFSSQCSVEHHVLPRRGAHVAKDAAQPLRQSTEKRHEGRPLCANRTFCVA